MAGLGAAVVFLIYLPFMTQPMLRTTGDEKVYIAQAIEMASAGTWFKQTLGQVPSYYKGPAHYILLRAGFLLFGSTSPLAFLFMNAIAVLASAAAVGYAVYRWRERNFPDALFAGSLACAMMSLNTGLFSHAHASQMEAELIAIYAIMTAIMVGAAKSMESHPYRWQTDVRYDYWLWIMAGIAGWFKSPVYSVLTGTSILVWWTMSGQLARKVRSLHSWVAIATGIAVGVAAYVPVIALDWKVFLKTFIQRENLAKGGNEHSWLESMVPLATIFLFPFWGVVASSVARSLAQLARRGFPRQPGIGAPCAAMILPTVIFFATFPFRSHIYYLPVIPAIYVWATNTFLDRDSARNRLARALLLAETLLMAVVVLAVLALLWWMPSDPRWMPTGKLVVATVSAVTGVTLMVRACRVRQHGAHWMLAGRISGAAAVFLAISMVMSALGKADILDIRQYLDRTPGSAGTVEVRYVDSIRHTWSEWGLLNGLVGHDVRAVRSSSEIDAAIQRGAIVLVSREADLAAIKARDDGALRITGWSRWQTHGRDTSGKSRFLDAVLNRSWKPLQRNNWIVQKKVDAAINGQAAIDIQAIDKTSTNIILLTWDGVRPQEFFNGHAGRTLLPYFWTQLAPRGVVLGDGSQITTIANSVVMSLPAYQTILTGQAQWCFSNECGGVTDQTISDRLVFQEGVPPRKVATIASWSLIGSAATSSSGSGFVNAGNTPVADSDDDPVLSRINEQQALEKTPWANARYDKFTHQIALHWLKKHKPRFMHISLNDTDEYGHRGEFDNYAKALRTNDHRLRELVDTLAETGDYGKNTCIVMTTDHGRGSGRNWTRHSNGQPLAARIWMYLGCPFSAQAPRLYTDTDLVTHLDIRPTIEASLGLEPRPCRYCGEAITKLNPQSTVFAFGGN